MFATLQPNRQNNDDLVLRLGGVPTAGHPFSLHRLACNQCRAKKLRCSGEKTGCDRCATKSLQCTYPSLADRRKRSSSARQAHQASKSETSDPQPSKPPNPTPPPEPQPQLQPQQPSQQQQQQTPSDHESSHERQDSAMGDDFTPLSFGNEAAVNELFEGGDFDPKLHLDAAADMHMPSADDLLQLTATQGAQGDDIMVGLRHDDEDMHLFDISASSLLSPVCFDLDELNLTTAATTPRFPDFSNASCGCVLRSLLLLEEIELQKSRGEGALSDSALTCNKRVLSQCEQLIGCMRCSAVASSMVILCLLCDKLLDSFHRFVTASKQQQQQQQQQLQHLHGEGHRQRESGGAWNAERGESNSRLFLGDYEIECPQEWKQVVSSLAGIQLKRLQAVMGRFRVLAECAGWESKLVWLRGQEQRLHEAISHFRTLANDLAFK